MRKAGRRKAGDETMALEHEELTGRIIGAAIEVHRVLGPGFLESVYQRSLELELRAQGIPFVPQHEVRVRYRDVEVGRHLLDLYVNELIVVELKAVRSRTRTSRSCGPTFAPLAGSTGCS
jgi:GxxExxY protein